MQFALKTLLGAGLALWLAMRWELEQPVWALMTAIIVAQPLSGMVVQKGFARLFGTIVGTVMSVVIMSISAQAPWLFLLILALWLGVCTAISTVLRSAWAYAFVLAGYTVAIIALPSINNPVHVFDQAVARCTEISLGIVCATFASAVFWPLRVEGQLIGQAQKVWESGLKAARAMLLGEAEERRGLLGILGSIVAVDAQREHAWFEGASGRTRSRGILALSQKLLMMLRAARTTRRQWRQLNETEAASVKESMDQCAQVLEQGDPQRMVTLRQQVVVRKAQSISSGEQYCLARLTVLLDTAIGATAALKDVENGRAPSDVQEGLAVHRDWSIAMLFGARSALAFLAMVCFWLATGWLSAPGGLVLTCVVCGLFASKENGAQIGMFFIRGILIAIPVALLVGQFILPQWSGFPMLAMAMGVPLFFGALGIAFPKVSPTATSFCLHFIMLVGPQNTMHFDVAAVLNSAQSILFGVGAAVVAFKLLVFRIPYWQARRLRASLQDDLVRLTQRNLRGAETWFGGRMADRLMQLARLQSGLGDSHNAYWNGALHGLDMGDELLHLRLCLASARLPTQHAQGGYLRQLRSVLEHTPTADRADDLQMPTQKFLDELNSMPTSEMLELARGAVLQLQNSWRKWCLTQEKTDGAA